MKLFLSKIILFEKKNLQSNKSSIIIIEIYTKLDFFGFYFFLKFFDDLS